MHDMIRAAAWPALLACVCAAPSGARAQDDAATQVAFSEALERAGEASGAVRAARADLGVADARVDAAGVWRANPSVSAQAGPRLGPDGAGADFWVDARQPVATGARLRARVDVARRERAAARHLAHDSERLSRLTAARAYALAAHRRRAAELARENLTLLTELERAASARSEVGDGDALEVSRAALAVASARADLARREADAARAEDRLAFLIGEQPGARVSATTPLGEVARGRAEGAPARADVEAARARLEATRAHAELARARALPVFTLGVRAGREEGDALARLVLGASLPLFDHGQGDLRVAHARAHAAQARLDAARREVDAERAAAARRSERLERAVAAFEARGAQAMRQTERRAHERWRAGATGLGELLVIRAELVRAGDGYNDLLLEAALARIELRASHGEL